MECIDGKTRKVQRVRTEKQETTEIKEKDENYKVESLTEKEGKR